MKVELFEGKSCGLSHRDWSVYFKEKDGLLKSYKYLTKFSSFFCVGLD